MTTTEQAIQCGYRTLGTDRRCTIPPANHVAVGCVHEHVNDGWLCDEHLQELNEGHAACLPCYRLPGDSHRCRVIGRVMA